METLVNSGWVSFFSFCLALKVGIQAQAPISAPKGKCFSEEYLSEEELVKLNNIHEKDEKMGSLVVVLLVAGCCWRLWCCVAWHSSSVTIHIICMLLSWIVTFINADDDADYSNILWIFIMCNVAFNFGFSLLWLLSTTSPSRMCFLLFFSSSKNLEKMTNEGENEICYPLHTYYM